MIFSLDSLLATIITNCLLILMTRQEMIHVLAAPFTADYTVIHASAQTVFIFKTTTFVCVCLICLRVPQVSVCVYGGATNAGIL